MWSANFKRSPEPPSDNCPAVGDGEFDVSPLEPVAQIVTDEEIQRLHSEEHTERGENPAYRLPGPCFGILNAIVIQNVMNTATGMPTSVCFASFRKYLERTGLPLQTTFSAG